MRAIFSGWWYNTVPKNGPPVSLANPRGKTLKDKERPTNEVAILEVEAVELVAGSLCIHHVLINNEGCTFGVVGNALADLAGTRALG